MARFVEALAKQVSPVQYAQSLSICLSYLFVTRMGSSKTVKTFLPGFLGVRTDRCNGWDEKVRVNSLFDTTDGATADSMIDSDLIGDSLLSRKMLNDGIGSDDIESNGKMLLNLQRLAGSPTPLSSRPCRQPEKKAAILL